MGDENAKQAAQEYLATRMTEEGQLYEEKMNREAAVALAPKVWKRVADTVVAQCKEWNAVTKEQTLTCKETALGDLRVWCAGRNQQMTVHFDSKKGVVTIKNTARLEHETDVIMRIEGYATESGRDARLVRNEEIVNLEMLLLGELRILSGLGRRANG